MLPLGAIIALVWVNTAPKSYFRFTLAIAFAVNGIAIVFFSGSSPRRWSKLPHRVECFILAPCFVPVVAAVAATSCYSPAVTSDREALDEPVAIAWPVTFATDCRELLHRQNNLRRAHPVIPFLLLIGIASGVFGFVVVVFNPCATSSRIGALILVVAMGIASGIRRARVRSFWPYILAGGNASWWGSWRVRPGPSIGTDKAFLGRRDPGFLHAPPDARDTLNKFENWWQNPAQVALFFFGLVNAGVLSSIGDWNVGFPIAVM